MKKKTGDELTPMMKQYYDIKTQYPDTILMFRVGDFFEMFNEDAKTAAQHLDITLTSKPMGGGIRVPLAGVPYHAVNNYIARLVKKGLRITLCDQVEDPKFAKGIVKRDIIRVITPGTAFTTGVENPKQNSFLLCLYQDSEKSYIAYCDLSEGEIIACEMPHADLAIEIKRVDPAEIIVRETDTAIRERMAAEFHGVSLTPYADYHFLDAESDQVIRKHFKLHTVKGLGFYQRHGLKIASGALLAYLYETQKGMVEHIRKVRIIEPGTGMYLDESTIRNLELFVNLHDSTDEYSLVWAVDHCLTGMGSRLLRAFIRRPLTGRKEIEFRLDAVNELREQSELCAGLGAVLTGMPDLYRLAGRIGLRICSPRDLLALAEGLSRLPVLKEKLSGAASEGLLWIKDTVPDDLQPAREKIEQAIDPSPPATLRDGGVFRDGYHTELDELRHLTRGGKEWIAELVKAERERTGISSLKIGYTNVFGYYIEVTNANLKNVPEYYIRKQTLANGERFITPELKEKEAMILKAEEKIVALEQRLFDELCRVLDTYLELIQTAAGLASHLDVFLNFGVLARDRDYCRPTLTDSPRMSIVDGRHPVVELLKRRGEFVANDTELSDSAGMFHIITGPNMAGKSTYIRQVALITLMAHCGSFVPATAAQIGLADRIFTRIGASDYLAGGLSTFMVEMTETANILNNATGRSLVILDEIGRGTSTYDGLSIAWAVSEYIIDQLKCRTLFATHFHELAELSSQYQQIKNFNISVKEWNGEIVFLHKIVAGCTDRSYGVYVARLAGVPEPVITKAKVILNLLEREGRSINLSEQDIRQLDLFPLPVVSVEQERIIDRIRKLDIDAIKPLDALNLLCDIQKQIKLKP